MLSERQIRLLQEIINEYIDSARPVGSVELVDKYNIKCSPATVRNEMAKLIDLGFLTMLHTSSGRVPTKQAYRFYIEELMEEKDLPVLQEVAMKQRLWTNRFQLEKLLRETVLAMSEITNNLAVATTEEGFVTHAGAVHALDNQEFWDIDVAKAALSLIDSYEMLQKVFQNAPFGEGVRCIIEEEIGLDKLNNCAITFSQYKAGKINGHIAVLGPSRLNYGAVLPTVRYARDLLQELGSSW